MTERPPDHPRLSFGAACFFEGLIGVGAVALGVWFELPVLSRLVWDSQVALAGFAATLPMLGLFGFISFSPWFKNFRSEVEPLLRGLFRSWSVWQLAVISVLAGVSEELFFRGLVQGGLTEVVGDVPALALASLLFAIMHWINATYAVAALLMGLLLGALWLWSGNLLTPVVAHAAYDFVALMWITRRRRLAADTEVP